MSEMLYEVIRQTEFEVALEATTIDKAMGVVYTLDEARDYFGGSEEGDSLDFARVGYGSQYLMLTNIINRVNTEFEKSKRVANFTGIPTHIIQLFNPTFKQHGFAFRGQLFVKWNPTAKKNNTGDKRLIYAMKNVMARAVVQHLSKKYDFSLKISDARSDVGLASVMKFAKVHDITLDLLLVHQCGWHGYDTWISLRRDHEPSVYSKSLEIVTAWYNSHVA